MKLLEVSKDELLTLRKTGVSIRANAVRAQGALRFSQG